MSGANNENKSKNKQEMEKFNLTILYTRINKR